jgi:hypothetical protein
MIAADLNSRISLFRLIIKSLWVCRQRPSFAAASGLIVCQVQAKDSSRASFKVRGVFAEILTPESADVGAECAGYRDSRIRFTEGRRWPALVYHSLQISRTEFGYQLRAKSRINHQTTESAEFFEGYANARAAGISWVRGCLIDVGDIQPGEPEHEARPFSLSFPSARGGQALRWMPEEERKALLGDAGAQDGAQDAPCAETGSGGQQARNTRSLFGG